MTVIMNLSKSATKKVVGYYQNNTEYDEGNQNDYSRIKFQTKVIKSNPSGNIAAVGGDENTSAEFKDCVSIYKICNS